MNRISEFRMTAERRAWLLSVGPDHVLPKSYPSGKTVNFLTIRRAVAAGLIAQRAYSFDRWHVLTDAGRAAVGMAPSGVDWKVYDRDVQAARTRRREGREARHAHAEPSK